MQLGPITLTGDITLGVIIHLATMVAVIWYACSKLGVRITGLDNYIRLKLNGEKK